MKRYQYIVAAACLLVSAMGFAGLYATSQTKEEDKSAKKEQIIQDSGIEDEPETQNEGSGDQYVQLEEEPEELRPEDFETPQEEPVATITEEVLHFSPEYGLVWPVDGAVLLDYSMDGTVFFPTLQQYQYNPAMVLAGKVNEKVYFVARGKVTEIFTNEETGCTVVQDIGDGYTAIYGQLKEPCFEVGDMVESGQVVGYINEPTKYYSVEGSNVYFQILKDGVPIDPEDILP